jgi:ribonuclease Z
MQASEFAVPAPGESVVVLEREGVTVRMFAVNHAPVDPAVGYRIEHRDRVVSISGDTIDTPGLRALASGANVLVAEVMDKHFVLDTSCALGRAGSERAGAIYGDIYDYHVDTIELAKLSAEAGVGTLMLTHQVPALPSAQAQV